MLACSSATSKGLLTKSSAPALIPSRRSWRSACEVTMITGISRVDVWSLSLRQTSKPCPRGATRSTRIRSGGFVAHVCSTSSPLRTMET